MCHPFMKAEVHMPTKGKRPFVTLGWGVEWGQGLLSRRYSSTINYPTNTSAISRLLYMKQQVTRLTFEEGT